MISKESNSLLILKPESLNSFGRLEFASLAIVGKQEISSPFVIDRVACYSPYLVYIARQVRVMSERGIVCCKDAINFELFHKNRTSPAIPFRSCHLAVSLWD